MGNNNVIKITSLFFKLVIGLVIGFALNISWYIFTGVVLGWGDSAPNWYFKIQNIVFNGVLLISVIGVFFVSHFLNKKEIMKRNEESW